MKLFLSLLLTVLAMLGIIDAGYITYGELTGIVPNCQPPFSCQTVLDSPWSKVGPVPLAAFGLVFYAVMFTLGIISFMDIRSISIQQYRVPVHVVVAVLGSLGMLFSMWLLFVMGVILKAWCLYCLLSALNCSMIFILSVILFRTTRMDLETADAKDSYAMHI